MVYINEKSEFYDTFSFQKIYFLTSGEPVYLFPDSISVSLNFDSEEHKNLRGQTVGILRSFRGGSLTLNMPSDSFFRDEFRGRFEALLDIFILVKEQNYKSMYLDKLTCYLQSFELSTDDPYINSSMQFTIHKIYREDLLKGIPQKLLFEIDSTYYVKLEDDPTKLELVYCNIGNCAKNKGQDVSLALEHITSFKANNKLRHNQKRMDAEGTWLWIQDGVEPATIQVNARLYDIVDYEYGSLRKHENKLLLKENTLPKEEILKALIKLLNNEIDYGKQGKLPYEIYLKSILIQEISPYSYTFHLTKVDYEHKNNYIEVQLEFVERREERPSYKPYTPKNKAFLNKKENMFTTKDLGNPFLDEEILDRAKKWIK